MFKTNNFMGNNFKNINFLIEFLIKTSKLRNFC